MDEKHDPASGAELELTGKSTDLWEVLQSLSSKEEVLIHRPAQSSYSASIETGWETIAITIISAGGIRALSRIIVTHLRQRQTTLEVEFRGHKIHFNGSQKNLGRTLSELERLISDPDETDTDPDT